MTDPNRFPMAVLGLRLDKNLVTLDSSLGSLGGFLVGSDGCDISILLLYKYYSYFEWLQILNWNLFSEHKLLTVIINIIQLSSSRLEGTLACFSPYMQSFISSDVVIGKLCVVFFIENNLLSKGN